MSDADESEGQAVSPIGSVLDALGVESSVRDGELPAGAIVLLKVIGVDGDMRLSVSHSDGLGWIERCGMLRLAELIESSPARQEEMPDGL